MHSTLKDAGALLLKKFFFTANHGLPYNIFWPNFGPGYSSSLYSSAKIYSWLDEFFPNAKNATWKMPMFNENISFWFLRP